MGIVLVKLCLGGFTWKTIEIRKEISYLSFLVLCICL